MAGDPYGALHDRKLLSENPEADADAAVQGIRDLREVKEVGLAKKWASDTPLCIGNPGHENRTAATSGCLLSKVPTGSSLYAHSGCRTFNIR